MSKKMTQLVEEGYKIMAIINQKPFNGSVHYYIPKIWYEKLKNRQLYIIEKDGKMSISSEEE